MVFYSQNETAIIQNLFNSSATPQYQLSEKPLCIVVRCTNFFCDRKGKCFCALRVARAGSSFFFFVWCKSTAPVSHIRGGWTGAPLHRKLSWLGASGRHCHAASSKRASLVHKLQLWRHGNHVTNGQFRGQHRQAPREETRWFIKMRTQTVENILKLSELIPTFMAVAIRG